MEQYFGPEFGPFGPGKGAGFASPNTLIEFAGPDTMSARTHCKRF